jgi:hypothetical protein
MNINEIKNKLNDLILKLVEETVKRELKHEKIKEIKESNKHSALYCEVGGRLITDQDHIDLQIQNCGSCSYTPGHCIARGKEKIANKSESKPELEPGDICEVAGNVMVYFDNYGFSGVPFFVDERRDIGNKDATSYSYANWKLIKKANPKNKIVIARDNNEKLWIYFNPYNLIWCDGYFTPDSANMIHRLPKKAFPEIKPGEKIEIEF